MNPNLIFKNKEEMDEYIAWCESTTGEPPEKAEEMEDDLANPAISKFFEKSSSGEVNTGGGETMDLDQNLSAEVEAEGHMKDMTEDMYAVPQGEEEMTDAPELPIQDWYDSSVAPFTTLNRTRQAPSPTPKPHLSVEGMSHQQDMNTVPATEFSGLGMLKSSSQSFDHSSSLSSGRGLATQITPPQAQAPVVAAPFNSDQSWSPARHLPDVDMLDDDTRPQLPSSNQPEQQCSSKASNASPSQSESYSLAPVSSVAQHNSLSQYRHTPLIRLSLDEGDDTTTSSVPGLNNETEDQASEPYLFCKEEGPLMIALREAFVAMSLNDGAESNWQPDKDDMLIDDVPLVTGSRETTLSNEHRLYPIAKRTCPAAESSSSTDEPASKTRHTSGIHASFPAYLPSTNFAPSKKPGSFGTSTSKSSAVPPKPIASNSNTQRNDIPPTNFAPSKKPGSFGISTSKSSAVSLKPIASNSNTQRNDIPPTTSVQSAKPSSSTSVNNQMSNVVASSPDASGLLTPGLGSTSGPLFVQSKKPGTWLDRKPKKDAVSVAPVPHPAATLDRPDATMEPDVPVNSAFASSNESVSAMQVDESQHTAPKPFAPLRPSEATLTSNKNESGPFQFSGSPKLPAAGGRATQGNGTARRAGPTTIRRAARTETNASGASHIGRTRNGFRDRSDDERRELEDILHQVPDQFKIDVHKVIQSQVCDVVPPLSDETVRSIPDLAKTGPGASVGPHPFAEKFRSRAECGRDLTYFRELRQKTPQVWLDLITILLQSGRNPKDILNNECDEILGAEWVIDLARVDKVAREGSAADPLAFFARDHVSMTLRPLFDQAVDKLVGDGRKVFEMAVKNWIKHDKSGSNKVLFIQCLERAGWTQAHSHFTRFMGWATGDAPAPIKRACFNHFRWAFPRLLRAVSTERLEKTQPLTVE